MILLELIIQGLGSAFGLKPSASGTTKVPLKGGFNLIQTSTRTTSNTVKELLLALLYAPDTFIDSILAESPDKVRGGITFRTAQQETLRLVKDFSAQALSLSRFKEDKKQFEELSKESNFVEELLRSRCNLPSVSAYQTLFVIGGDGYEKFVAPAQPQVSAVTGQDYFQTLEDVQGGGTPAALKQRLAQLKSDLSRMEELQDLELKLDEQQQLIFEKEEIMRRFQEKQASLRKAEEELQAQAHVPNNVAIPEDVKAKVEKYLKASNDKAADLAKLDAKAEKLIADLNASVAPELYKNPMLLAGAGLFLISLILNSALPQVKPFTVGGLVAGLGLAVFALLQHFNRAEKQKLAQLKVSQLEHERKALEKKYEIEMSAVSHLMMRLQIKEPQEILSFVRERDHAALALKAARQELENLKRTLNVDKVSAELKELEKQAEAMRKKMESFNLGHFDAAEMKREIAALSQKLGVPADQKPRLSAKEPSTGHPLERLAAIGATLLKTTPEKLFEKILKGFETNLVAISSRRLMEPVCHGGTIQGFTTGKGGKTLALENLDDLQNFAAYFALQFTLLQVLSRHGVALPVLALGLPEVAKPALPLVHKALTHLGQTTQVLALSADQELASTQAADVVL